LTKDGTGTLNLGAAKSDTGATAISAGTTNVAGSFGNTAIGLSGGILSLQAADAVSQNTVTVGGTGSIGADRDRFSRWHGGVDRERRAGLGHALARQ